MIKKNEVKVMDERTTTPLIDVKYVDINQAKTREKTGEVLDSESVTEQAGYIPPKEQIESMILAGQRLDDYRKAMYDFSSEDEIDESAIDPTRSGNFDLADATQLKIQTEKSLVEQAEKSSQTAQIASVEPQKVSEGVNTPIPAPEGN